MSDESLAILAELIRREASALLSNWRAEVRKLPSAAQLDVPTLNDHIPLFLTELADAFHARSLSEVLKDGVSPSHGLQRVEDGFDISEVVAEYNILRNCIHDLADQYGVSLKGESLRILNGALDGAIALAVQKFSAQKALEVQRRREEYLAFVMHDLRTPLHAISLSSRVLELQLPRASINVETSQMMKSLRRNVSHLEELITKVIEENSNLQTEVGIKVERRIFDLWPLVESLIHDLHPIAGTDSVKIVNQIPDDLTVSADAGLLRRVFQNLIANSIRHTPYGQIVIEARDLESRNGVECTVSDNGSGISAGLLENLFEKGESEREEGEGSGLGLAIVKTFIEAHGGTISVESQEGVGTTFCFVIPKSGQGGLET